MQNQTPEVYFIVTIGIIIGLILVGFIVTVLVLYQGRQRRQEREIIRMKDLYEKEALRSQLEIQENTFKNIAQELHDNIGQMLSVVKLTLSILPIEESHAAFPQITSAKNSLHKAIADLSGLTKGLHTDRVAQVGLSESIRFEIGAINKSGILQADFHQTGPEIPFNDQTSIFLFRIFQESLNNILKHAKASLVVVNLTFLENLFTLEIIDDGVGFSVAEKKGSNSSYSGVGLRSLSNRAKLIGADLSIDSAPSRGTTILIELPL